MHTKDDTEATYAVKVYSKDKENDGDKRHFQQECFYLSKLSHPHIVKLLHFNEAGQYQNEFGEEMEVRYSVLELAPNGNLLDFVLNKPMNSQLVRFYFR